MRFLGAGGKMGFGRGYPYATGGDYVYLYEDTETGKTYRVHEFLSTGTSTLNVEVGGKMDILIVGGGGSGGVSTFGGAGAGGGGAGGVLLLNSQNIAKGTHDITVGAGGSSTSTDGTAGNNGGNSSIVGNSISKTALGGGAGGGSGSQATAPPTTGGSGGGGGSSTGTSGAKQTGANGTEGQGNAGGDGFSSTTTSSDRGGGGGGGAGEAGSDAVSLDGGDGGDGIAIWGRYFGGGGGGSFRNNSYVGLGGLGGGGKGGNTTLAAGSGTENTGGGGGGQVSGTSGAGGSGIVIVRYVVGEESYDIEEGQSLGTPTATQSSAGTWSLGEISDQDLVLAFDAIFPSTPAQGCLAEKGGTTLGFWCGLKSSGTYFRVRAGGGGSAPASNITLLDIYDFPADDQLHTVVVEINVGTGMTMRVWIDGVYKGSATSTATSAAGTGSGVFLSGGANVNITGEPTAAWPGGTAQGEARFYSNTLIS